MTPTTPSQYLRWDLHRIIVGYASCQAESGRHLAQWCFLMKEWWWRLPSSSPSPSLSPLLWDHVPTSPSSTQRLGVCGLCDAQTAQRALCTCSRLLLTDRCYRRSVARIVELWKHALVELRRRSMSTEATRQRKRVASLWDWAMPGLVMRVHGDCARNSLEQIETHIAPDDTSATLLKRLEVTTDGIQHQIAVLSKYQNTLQQKTRRSAKSSGRVTASKLTTLRDGKRPFSRSMATASPERDAKWTTRELVPRKDKTRIWTIEIVIVGGAFPTGKETRCGPARSGPQRHPQSEPAHTALERETVFSSSTPSCVAALRASAEVEFLQMCTGMPKDAAHKHHRAC